MITDFSIDVANPLGGLQDAVGGYLEGAREDKTKKLQQDKLAEASRLMQNGDHNGLTKLMMENPSLREHIIGTQNHVNKAAETAKVRTLGRIANGEDPKVALSEHIEQVRSQGGNPAESEAFLKQIENGGMTADQIREKAILGISVYDPVRAKSITETLETFKPKAKDGGKWQAHNGVLYNDKTGATMALRGGDGTIDLDVLTKGMDPELSTKFRASYSAAGGKQAGLNAANQVVADHKTGQNIAKFKTDLPKRFPGISGKNLTRLENSIEGASSLEEAREFAQAEYDRQEKFKQGSQKKKKVVGLLKKLMKNPEWRDVVGPKEAGMKEGDWTLSSKEGDALADIEEAVAMLTADNLSLMSGTLTKEDIIMLEKVSAGALSRVRSEDEFERRVNQLIGILGKADHDPTQGDNQGGQTNQSQGNEINSSYQNMSPGAQDAMRKYGPKNNEVP